jgi:hypothetical protein
MADKKPDDSCKVCSDVREGHDDRHEHLFSDDGQLVPKKQKGPEPIRVSPDQVTIARLGTLLRRRGLMTELEYAWMLTGNPEIGREILAKESPVVAPRSFRDPPG